MISQVSNSNGSKESFWKRSTNGPAVLREVEGVDLSVIFITQMSKKSYPNRSAAEILGKKKYPAENLGTKKYPLRFGYQKYPPRFWVPKSNKIKGKIERGRAKTLNFRACGGLKANISLIQS